MAALWFGLVVLFLEPEITIKRLKIYAILDIETTGGKYNEEGITEIAIYKHDGKTIIDQFISLVNPKRPIQPGYVRPSPFSGPHPESHLVGGGRVIIKW